MASSDTSTCSTAALLNQASELNEDGIYELASGLAGPAIAHLEEAGRLLMQCLESSSSQAIPMEREVHSTSRVQIPHLNDDLFYIYSCAVSYTPPSSQTDSPVFGLAVVTFNLALAYHQQARTTSGAHAEASARQALTYYKECQQALQALNNTQNSTTTTAFHHHNMQDEDLLLMTLACMNNQARIQYELDSSATKDPVFQKLLTCSMHAILRADQCDNLSMVEQSQIHEFVQNAMVFGSLKRPCAAPSA